MSRTAVAYLSDGTDYPPPLPDQLELTAVVGYRRPRPPAPGIRAPRQQPPTPDGLDQPGS